MIIPRPFSFLFNSTIAQAIGLCLFLIIDSLSYGLKIGTLLWSISALLTAQFLALPKSWQLLNLILPFALVLNFSQNASSSLFWWSLPLVLLYLPTFLTRVPYYPSNPLIFEAIDQVVQVQQKIIFTDLGCGFSSLLVYLAKRYPAGKFVGYEISPLCYLVSRLRALRFSNITIRYHSFWRADLSDFTIIYAFLAPPPMEPLWQKLKSEMRKDSILIVNSFALKKAAERVIEIRNTPQKLYIYFTTWAPE